MKHSVIVTDAIDKGMQVKQEHNTRHLQEIIGSSVMLDNPEKVDRMLDKFTKVIAHMRDVNNEWKKEQSIVPRGDK